MLENYVATNSSVGKTEHNTNERRLLSGELNPEAPLEEETRRKRRAKNDIRDIRSFKQLDKVDLELDSPRFTQAADNLGISISECRKKPFDHFAKKGVDADLADLRYKHFQSRLIDTINRVLQERRTISKCNSLINNRAEMRQQQREMLAQRA